MTTPQQKTRDDLAGVASFLDPIDVPTEASAWKNVPFHKDEHALIVHNQAILARALLELLSLDHLREAVHAVIDEPFDSRAGVEPGESEL